MPFIPLKLISIKWRQTQLQIFLMIAAPVRNFFNRGKVKEDVQQGVDAVVNTAQQGLQTISDATNAAG